MSSQTASYSQHTFADPIVGQRNFAEQYALRDPEDAMSSYARIMHQHTKRQLDGANESARRRSNNGSVTSLSSQASVESAGSASS